MKTNHANTTAPRPRIFKTSSNLTGGILLLSLCSTGIISVNLIAFSDLFTAFESEWMQFTGWMSGLMSQPFPVAW